MSKAVRFHQVGGREVLKIEEVSTRNPQAGEVAIDVAAVGLNRAESMYYRVAPVRGRAALPFPHWRHPSTMLFP